jgi:hypothetical protein
MIKKYETFRRKLALARIQAKLKRRKVPRSTVNFEQTTDIALILYAKNEMELEPLQNFRKNLIGMGKKVICIVYCSEKNMELFQKSIPNITYITKKDFNFWRLPKSRAAGDFIKTRCDIVVDLTQSKHFETAYLVALSRASYRVGVFQSDLKEYYDFMIDMKNNENVNAFIDQLKKYWNMIKVDANV